MPSFSHIQSISYALFYDKNKSLHLKTAPISKLERGWQLNVNLKQSTGLRSQSNKQLRDYSYISFNFHADSMK